MTHPGAGASAFPETADIETASDAYAARFAGRTGAWMLGVQERVTRLLLEEEPAASVLDVGGGHGQLAVPLARAGYAVTVTGSDESCRRRILGELDSGRCRFLVADSLKLVAHRDGLMRLTVVGLSSRELGIRHGRFGFMCHRYGSVCSVLVHGIL